MPSIARTDLFHEYYELTKVEINGMEIECFTDGDRHFMNRKQVAKNLKIKSLSTLHNIVKGIRREHKNFAKGGVFRIDELQTIKLVIEKTEERLKEDGYLYLIKEKAAGLTKIGITRNIESRLSHLETMTPLGIKEKFYVYIKDYKKKERELHKRFEHCRINGEWFNLKSSEINLLKKELEVFDLKKVK